MRISVAMMLAVARCAGGAGRGERKDARRVRAAPECGTRGRSMIAFGAHTDEPFVQRELERLVASAQRFACPPHDVVLFVDGTRDYKTLRHPLPGGVTVRVPLQKLLKNGTSAFRVFVSHQLLMAALPSYVADDKTYDYAWIVEEDAKMVQGEWHDLFAAFNGSAADLVAWARQTNRGRAALLPTARLSTRLLRAVHNELRKIDAGAKGAHKKTIHGAFTYQMCTKAKWCSYAKLPDEWLGIYRAKCAWNAKRFEALAPDWHNPTDHGLVFHPVKLHAQTSGRDFKHFRCKDLFQKEAATNEKNKVQAAAAALAASKGPG